MKVRIQQVASLIDRVEAMPAVDYVRADYENGLIRLWAPAAAEEIRTVDVR